MRPLQKSADKKRREDKQRVAVRKRDSKLGCRFERRIMSGKWVACGKKEAQDTAHILRRHQCGDVWDDVRVAILACRSCHLNYDNNTTKGDTIYEVRVPYDLALEAWEFVLANTKSRPYGRYNPDTNPQYKDLIIGRAS